MPPADLDSFVAMMASTIHEVAEPLFYRDFRETLLGERGDWGIPYFITATRKEIVSKQIH